MELRRIIPDTNVWRDLSTGTIVVSTTVEHSLYEFGRHINQGTIDYAKDHLMDLFKPDIDKFLKYCLIQQVLVDLIPCDFEDLGEFDFKRYARFELSFLCITSSQVNKLITTCTKQGLDMYMTKGGARYKFTEVIGK